MDLRTPRLFFRGNILTFCPRHVATVDRSAQFRLLTLYLFSLLLDPDIYLGDLILSNYTSQQRVARMVRTKKGKLAERISKHLESVLKKLHFIAHVSGCGM